MAPIRLSGSAINFSTRPAFSFPPLDILCMFEVDVAVKDVSEPEKNPEKIIRRIIEISAIISSVSIA
jgi:hypothetical protein